ncbi:S-adenosyl-L-methionine-dependent methyltransferases superfamily protein [Theobroma cacao]|uniref:S-adenosyl-L-methionine-dependent methyltransferases superfamily protein n=1 Tax=Theobroma cacao TaxID=3641 RepID=A0A061GS74_THECC|nr:S-adenosyl-L-methionine-dependent methyltransferases superfamily protein [Theobroma cacao]
MYFLGPMEERRVYTSSLLSKTVRSNASCRGRVQVSLLPPSHSLATMARFKAKQPSGAAEKPKKPRMSSAERSAYFARREAAKVLRSVLQGDARRRAVGSIKSLVYSPSVKNKKATFALVCQTLKHLPIIKDVLEAANVLNSRWKRQEELVYIITYDILFGQEISFVGDAEKFLVQRKVSLQSVLAQLLVRKKVKRIEDLIYLYQTPDVSKPRYVRVNTLKMGVDSALIELGKQYMVQKDDLVPDLLKLPPKCDLHDHPLVMNGSVLMQGKASSMVAAALGPEPGWEVLDACAAPGNKTVHLAALMRGKGRVIACELNKERIKRLEDIVRLSGAHNVEVLHGDFLSLDPKDPLYSKVCAILLDPSCSGSGTVAERLDHLLPSYAAGQVANTDEEERLNKLASFQKKALAHALCFPQVERVVYSTCSIHQIENEDVVKSILPLAASHGFQLATPFPQWNRRGLPVFEGSEHLLRTDLVEDKEGFFIALFVRKDRTVLKPDRPDSSQLSKRKRRLNKNKVPTLFGGMFKMWLYCRPNLRIDQKNTP